MLRKRVYINRFAAAAGEPCIMADGFPCSEVRMSGDVVALYRPDAPHDGATVYVECDRVEVVRA